MNKDLKYIADFYGLEQQLRQTQEECAELIVAISKVFRGEGYNDVTNEIADVEIMCEQIKYILGVSKAVEKVKQSKIERQLKRVEIEKEVESCI